MSAEVASATPMEVTSEVGQPGATLLLLLSQHAYARAGFVLPFTGHKHTTRNHTYYTRARVPHSPATQHAIYPVLGPNTAPNFGRYPAPGLNPHPDPN